MINKNLKEIFHKGIPKILLKENNSLSSKKAKKKN